METVPVLYQGVAQFGPLKDAVVERDAGTDLTFISDWSSILTIPSSNHYLTSTFFSYLGIKKVESFAQTLESISLFDSGGFQWETFPTTKPIRPDVAKNVIWLESFRGGAESDSICDVDAFVRGCQLTDSLERLKKIVRTVFGNIHMDIGLYKSIEDHDTQLICNIHSGKEDIDQIIALENELFELLAGDNYLNDELRYFIIKVS